jgi:PGF-pre-PGF domain-containing protein
MVRRLLIISLLLLFSLFVGIGAALPPDSEAEHVIVVMKDQPRSMERPVDLALFAVESQEDVISSLTRMGAREVTTLWSVNALATALTPEQQQEVSARADVAGVVPDRIVTLDRVAGSADMKGTLRFFTPFSSEVDSIDPSGYDTEDIAWGVSWIEAPEVWSNRIDGTGVTVAVVDTGIDAEHPDLAGKVIGWADLVNGREDPYDDHGHGTHCAGTIAGSGAGGIITGVAPGADLIGIKVFSQEGSTSLSTVIEGFETAVLLGADVISFSGGTIGYNEYSWYGSLNSTGEIDIPFEITNEGDGFDPSFILLWADTQFNDGLTVTMKKPDGSAYPGVSCDWYDFALSSDEVLLKYSGDEPLEAGEWTLHLAGTPVNESNLIWHSGKGNDLDNTLYQRFNLTDQIDTLESLTFELYTWYSVETGFDYSFVEVWSDEHDQWVSVLEYTGVGEDLYSVDLMDYITQTDNEQVFLDLRLRYETDESVVWPGWYIDWMAIPEIGFYDDASEEIGWIADPEYGWVRIHEERPIDTEWIILYADNGSSILSRAADEIVSDGTTIVTSAGNNGEYGLRTIGGPAAAEMVVAVGATGFEEDYIADYSSRGPSGWGGDMRIKPDVVAPGSSIISASTREGELYRSMDGTSMACPHVSGIAALLLQADPDLIPDEIRSLLTTTAVDLGEEGPDMSYGYGRVSAWAAVNAVLPLDPPVYEGPRLHAGFGYGSLKIGEPNTITAVSWDQLPVSGESIHFQVWNENGDFLNRTVSTDASGMALASFVPYETSYEYLVTDAHGNSVSGWIHAEALDPVETLLIDTPEKVYEALADSVIPISYTIVNPETMEPYAGDLRVIVRHNDEEYLNEVLTPLNGMIQLNVDGSVISARRGSIEISPVADESQVLFAGRISLYDSDETISVLSPVITRAVSGGNARLLVKEYSSLNARPAPDGDRVLPVIWLSEADVHSLSKRFPAEMNRLMKGDTRGGIDEYEELSAEIENLQMNVTYAPYQLRNGIGKVDLPVPDGAYLGYAIHGGDVTFIVVDLWPFSYHGITPPSEPSRLLSVSAEWEGEYSPIFRSVVPGDLVHVTCYLEDPLTGSPVQGRVYLYTADQSTLVMTGADGYGYASFPIQIRFEDAWGKNEIQIVGLSGDAYDYAFVYPPYERVVMAGEYAEPEDGGLLTASVSILGPEVTDWPAIFEVSRKDIAGEIGLPIEYLSQSASLLSEHITGSGRYMDAQPYGSYQTTVSMKDYFYRGAYSQGNWWSYYMLIGATPLIVETPPPERIERAGAVDVPVRMAGGEAGVPVYLTYASIDPSSYSVSGLDPYSDYGGVDVKTTGADGRATLRMNIPEDGYLWWEIGGGTPDLVFTTLSGYSLQQTPAPPTPPDGPGGHETAVASHVLAGAGTVLTYSGLPIDSISFTADADLTAAIITVDQVRFLPDGVAPPEPGAYQYFDITPNPNTLPHIRKGADIGFHLPGGYLTAMGMRTTDVALMRFVDGEWEQLPTTFIGMSGDLARYRATTPGFSLFAIVLQKDGAVVELAEPTPIPVVEEEEESGIVIGSDEVEVIIVEEAPITPTPLPDIPKPTPAPIQYAPAGLVAAALLVFGYRRRE